MLDRDLATGEWPCGQQGGCAFRCAEPTTCPRATLFLGHRASPGETQKEVLGPLDLVIPPPTTVAGTHTGHQGLCPPPEARPDPPLRTSRPWAHDTVFQGRGHSAKSASATLGTSAEPDVSPAAVQASSEQTQATALSSGTVAPASAVCPAGTHGHTLGDVLTPAGGSPEGKPPSPHQWTTKKWHLPLRGPAPGRVTPAPHQPAQGCVGPARPHPRGSLKDSEARFCASDSALVQLAP